MTAEFLLTMNTNSEQDPTPSVEGIDTKGIILTAEEIAQARQTQATDLEWFFQRFAGEAADEPKH